MAQDITLLGASYEDVPAVELPKTGGGTASFTDVTDSDVTPDDVMDGVTFYAPDGTKRTGTLSNVKLGTGGGNCTTSTTTVGGTRYVNITDYELVEGGIIAVYFEHDVPASSYLNVNSKGAKQVMIGTQTLSGDEICSGDIAFFMYFGNCYYLLGIDKSVELITDSELTTLETKLGL